MYGRGTVDDKDNVAAALMTMLLLKRSGVALDRDVIFLAEAGEEGTTRVGIQFMVAAALRRDRRRVLPGRRWQRAFAAAGACAMRRCRRQKKSRTRIMLTATGVAGHGSVPLETNSILKLTQAVVTVAAWKPPIQLNDTTRTYFTRLAAISPPADAARYRAVDRQRSEGGAGCGGLFREEPIRGSPRWCGARFRRTSSRAAIASTSFRPKRKRRSTCGCCRGRIPEAFLSEVRKVVNDPAIRVEWIKRDVRPATPSARLDSEVFKVLESAFARFYDTAVLPTMSTGATDMAYLRAKGIQCYGVGPALDAEDGPKGFGAHSDQERILESELHKFVRFHYEVVRDLARAQ